MKIIYNKNPLHSIVELDEKDKQLLWYKIKVEELEELLSNVHFHLEEGKYFDLEQARKDSDPDYYWNDEKSELDKRCDKLLKHYIIELNGYHDGDCTCIPGSCSKCHAESLLGINTISGLEKHAAYQISGSFGKNNEKSIDDVIKHLANYDPTPSDPNSESWKKIGGYEQYVPRWKAQAQEAHDWLISYKNEHFKDVN